MDDQTEDKDLYNRTIPTLLQIDTSRNSIIRKLEKRNPHYTVYMYRNPKQYKKSLRVLQKLIGKKHGRRPHVIEQILLTCILYKEEKLLNMNINVYSKVDDPYVERIKIFNNLNCRLKRDKSKVEVNKDLMELYNTILEGKVNFMEMDFIGILKKYKDNEYFNNENETYDNTNEEIQNSYDLEKKRFNIFCDSIESRILPTKINTENIPVLELTYDLKCNTSDYLTCIGNMQRLLKKLFDTNILFLYYYISIISCTNHNCKCALDNFTNMKKILTDPKYLEKQGYDVCQFIFMFYDEHIKVEDKEEECIFRFIEHEEITYKHTVETGNMEISDKYIIPSGKKEDVRNMPKEKQNTRRELKSTVRRYGEQKGDIYNLLNKQK